MTYEQAYEKLLNHGNLVASLDASNLAKDSFLFNLWVAENNGTVPSLDLLYRDILDALEVVNSYVNGDQPSENVVGKERQFERSLLNAMWYITHTGWECHRRLELNSTLDGRFRDELALTLWRISCAFGAVLDGDVDCLEEHVQNEEWAKW